MKSETLKTLASWLWEMSDMGYLPEFAEDYTPELEEASADSSALIGLMTWVDELVA